MNPAVTFILVLGFFIPPQMPVIDPPQRALELLVDKLTVWGMERVPDGSEVYRQKIRIFFDIESDATFWGAYVHIFHDGPGKPIFEIGSLGPDGSIRRGGLDIPKEDP